MVLPDVLMNTARLPTSRRTTIAYGLTSIPGCRHLRSHSTRWTKAPSLYLCPGTLSQWLHRSL